MDERDISRRDGETGAGWLARLQAMSTAGWNASERQHHQEAVRRAGWFAQAEASNPEHPPSPEARPTPLERIREDCLRLTAEERRQLRDWLGKQG
jgi:hypothetical protein